MANSIYPLWKQSIMSEFDTNNSLDQTGVNGCYVSLLTIGAGGYIYSDGDQYFSSVVGVQGAPVLVANPMVIGNVFSGTNVVFVSVNVANVGGIVMARQNSGASTTWRLVLYEDTGIIGLPLSTNGGNVLVKWNAQGIFGL